MRSELPWLVRFDCAADSRASSRVSVQITAGGCPASGKPLYATNVRREKAPSLPAPEALKPGTYALAGGAYDEQGKVIAAGCVPVELPRTEPVMLSLHGLAESACAEPPVEFLGNEDAGSGPQQCDTCKCDTDGGLDDRDGDGLPDCVDECPDDAYAKRGVCGCGVVEPDADGDETPDCVDWCPNDPAKIVSGACGCGESEVDTDRDETPDCNDGCAKDAAKVAPGTCGCGVPDRDSDGDGAPDCKDFCPQDASRTAPGVCPCGRTILPDNPRFVDSKGQRCALWLGYNCDEADTRWGYTASEETEIKFNCSTTCASCQ